MKLAAYIDDGERHLGLVVGDGLIDLDRYVPDALGDMAALIEDFAALRPALEEAARAQPDRPLSNVKLTRPIARPGKILAIGLNYLDHIEETKAEKPAFPTFFAKMPTAANGPFDPIELPAVSSMLDYEAELVIVIGRRCRNLPPERAWDAIFGYCVGNDVSVRDWQKRTPQWTVGKSFDTHAPFGPWITTAGDVNSKALPIRALVNGEVRQSSNTSNLLFDCAAQVSYLSQAMTLEPGDLIYTGTPSGVGMARNPPVWLKAGDRVRIEIDGLGAIENVVEAASGAPRME